MEQQPTSLQMLKIHRVAEQMGLQFYDVAPRPENTFYVRFADSVYFYGLPLRAIENLYEGLVDELHETV